MSAEERLGRSGVPARAVHKGDPPFRAGDCGDVHLQPGVLGNELT